MGKILIIGFLFLVVACAPKGPTQEQLLSHQQDVEVWYAKRIEDLKSHDGWLNLAGLFWLRGGMNSFGSDESNDIVFPAGKIDPKAGYFLVKGQEVTLIPSPGSALKEGIVFHPDSTKAIIQSHGSLEWFIIRRDDKLGIRLRDLESENVKNFEGIERYPVDYSWKLPAKFQPAAAGTKINITNVLGQTTAEDLTGTYTFEVNGQEYSLAATGNGKELFIVFGDATNGKETYGAGRFIYVPRPDSAGNVFIDFNKSYNPPCAFNDFATCPLPPKSNVLPVRIPAGEKNYDHHGKQTSTTL